MYYAVHDIVDLFRSEGRLLRPSFVPAIGMVGVCTVFLRR